MVKTIKTRQYLIQIEAKGFFRNDPFVLAAVTDHFTKTSHRVIDAEIDESSKPTLGHPGILRLVLLRAYPSRYDFGRLAAETQQWLTESFIPARTTLGGTRYMVTVRTLELRFDVDFDDEVHAPSETELEEIGMDADGAKS